MMNRFAAATLAFLLLGSGTYVLAATGGGAGDGGSAATTQYAPTTPEKPTYESTVPKPQTTGSQPQTNVGAGDEGESEIGGERRSGPNSAGAQPETRFASTPVESLATGPSGGATGLPFTGLELFALLVAGLFLLGLGVVPRGLRRSR